jgi:hypothetical protein
VNTFRWRWRLFEGYGCAVRSYAFAVVDERRPTDPTFLKCQAQLSAAGQDQLT